MSEKPEQVARTGPTICLQCKWADARFSFKDSDNVLRNVFCLNDEFEIVNYVTGNRAAPNCKCINTSGQCSGFEAAPPKPPAPPVTKSDVKQPPLWQRVWLITEYVLCGWMRR